MTQIESLLTQAVPLLQKFANALPALEEFEKWHNQEKDRIESERLAEKEHSQFLQNWLKSKQDEAKAREEHEARIKPLLK